MKAKLLFLLLAALSMPAMAQEPAADMCGEAQTLISSVMDRRIEGHSANEVYNVAITGEESGEFREWFANVVTTVYDLERYQLTGDERADILGRFFSTCVRAYRGELF